MSEPLNIGVIEALTLIHIKSLDSSELSTDKIVENYFNAYKKISKAYEEKIEKDNAENDFGAILV